MAIFRNGLVIVAVVVTFHILETRNVTDFPSLDFPQVSADVSPHARVKRDAPTGQEDFVIQLTVNATDQDAVEQIQSFINTSSLPLQLRNGTEISDMEITTVCISAGTGSECRCQEGFAWPFSICSTYGACDDISSGVCRCINGIPPDGSSCLPQADLVIDVEYDVEVEINVTDLATVNYLRSLISNGSFSLTLGPTVNLTSIEITTVCNPNGTGFQCRCEDEFYWPGLLCNTYGACDDILDDTCSCINGLPSAGQYCQPQIVPTEVYDYEVTIEVRTADVDQLRNSLRRLTFPYRINSLVNITAVQITTVCSGNDTVDQCRCENEFRWSCDQCFQYGACDDITNNTCGCLNSFPTDGQFCRPADYQNFTVCPTTTVSPSTNFNTTVMSTDVTTAATDSHTTTDANTTAATKFRSKVNTTFSTPEPGPANTTMHSTNQTEVNTTLATTAGPVANTTMYSTAEPADFNTTVTTATTAATINTTLYSTAEPEFPTDINTTAAVFTAINSTFSTPEPEMNTTSGVNATTTATLATSPTSNASSNTSAPTDFNTTISVATTPPATSPTTNTSMSSTSEPEINATTGVNIMTTSVTDPTFNPTTYSTAQPAVDTTTHASTGQSDTNTTRDLNSTAPTTSVATSTTASPSALLNWTTTDFTNSTPDIGSDTTAMSTTDGANTTQLTTTGSVNFTSAPVVTADFPSTFMTAATASSPAPTLTTAKTTSAVPSAADHTSTTPDAPMTAAPSSVATTTTPDAETTATTTPSSAVTKRTSVTPSTETPTTEASSTIPATRSTVHQSAPSPTTLDLTTVPATSPPSDSPSTIRKTTPLTETTTAPPASGSSTTVGETTTPTVTSVSTANPVATTPTTHVKTTPQLTTATTQEITVAPTDTPAPTAVFPAFQVDMSIELDRRFTADLNDPTSDGYNNLVSRIESVLTVLYQGINGFIDVSVTQLREGSVITDYVIRTLQVDADEIQKANEDLYEAMEPIAPVIGNVSVKYQSPTPIGVPPLTYTGRDMTLMCGPPPANVSIGHIYGSTWQFNGRDLAGTGRFQIRHDSMTSRLSITNIIMADAGLYTCILSGKVLAFTQNGVVTADNIKPAPVVRLKSKINAQCEEGSSVPLKCCVQSYYKVQWFQGAEDITFAQFVEEQSYCVRHDYVFQNCSQPRTETFTCRVDNPSGFEATTTLTVFLTPYTCNNELFGTGQVNNISEVGCDEGQEGRQTAVCQSNGEWRVLEDSCILIEIKELLIDSQDVFAEEVPQLVSDLNQVVQKEQEEVSNSSATVAAIVGILSNIANVSTSVEQTVMQGVLETVAVIVSDDAQQSWVDLNQNSSLNTSSDLLGSLEMMADRLVGEYSISTPTIMLNRSLFSNSFFAELNSFVTITIPDVDIQNGFITTLVLSTLRNVMPVRNTSFDPNMFHTTNQTVSDTTINAAVILVNLNHPVNEVTLSYRKLNDSLSVNPQCVFWNFSTFDQLGAWDGEGCTFVSDVNNTVTCSCNHLTSFSILMSTDIPDSIRELLDVITYVGVGISIASLLICLIIEAYVWKAVTINSTAFMRHVSIVNTALSLLTADICFIIGAAVAKNALENPRENFEVPIGPCSTATFFMHLSYLALFFWMLVSGLLLFYRTVMVFSHMARSTMLGVGFALGYGCPLLIAVITVAVTAPGNGYVRKESACWLNWTETKALLALVIPALTIVLINMLIIITVLFKILRRGVGETPPADDKHALFVITRCVIILTPLFGLTWSLGVGTMISPTNKGIHIAFAFFNSLQGFFILVFGTLLDSKIRSKLAGKMPVSGSDQARGSSHGSLSIVELFNRLRGRRYVYRVSDVANTSSNVATESFVNI